MKVANVQKFYVHLSVKYDKPVPMTEKIPYVKWRERINQIVPNEYRIGNDVFILPQHKLFQLPEGHFKTDVTTIIIYEKGWVRVSIDMKEYTVQAPSVVTFLPDTIYKVIERSEDLEYKIIIYSKNFTDNLFLNLDRMHPLRTAIQGSPVNEGVEHVYVYNKYLSMLIDLTKRSDSPYKLDAAKHLTLATFYSFSLMRHNVPSKQEDRVGRKDELFSDFVELVRRHFRSCRDVAFYADKLCVTVKYLSQVVKEKSGRPALDFIEQYVITECKALLLSTTMSIQQIADELHFPSQSVFGKYFKRATGVSPRDYRRNGV